MVTRKSAMLPLEDRQEIADLFSLANIKAEARLMNDSGIGHGEPDKEYLVTTGAVSQVVRRLEVRKDSLVEWQDYLDGYRDEKHTSCKVYARKRVWAQSPEEAKAIAIRQAVGDKRYGKMSDDETEIWGKYLMFSGNGYAAQAMAVSAECQADVAEAQAMAMADHVKRMETAKPLIAKYKYWLSQGDKMLSDGYARDLKEQYGINVKAM